MERETYWSRVADDFEKRVSYVAGKVNIDAVQAALADLELSGRILELGCGNGTYSPALASKADMLHVTDFSDQMVAICSERLKDMGNAKVEKQNCFALTYDGASFDSVAAINLLHVIAEPQKAIIESRRVLKSGGRLIVISFTTKGMSFFRKLGMTYRYLRTFGKPPAKAQALTVASTRDMLEKEGFIIEHARLIGETSKAVFVIAKNGF